jgi:hypothetical protein
VPISAEQEKVEAPEEKRIASNAPITISEKYFDDWVKTMQQKFREFRDAEAHRITRR